MVLRKADIDLTKRAGELTEDEVGDGDIPGGVGTSLGGWGHRWVVGDMVEVGDHPGGLGTSLGGVGISLGVGNIPGGVGTVLEVGDVPGGLETALGCPPICPQVERVITIMQNPRQYKIPDWFLNRQKDVKDGKYSQVGGTHVPESRWGGHTSPSVPKCSPVSPDAGVLWSPHRFWPTGWTTNCGRIWSG